MKLLSLSRRLDLLSRRDSLMGLPNRRDIIEKIEDEVSRFDRNQKTFCVQMVDLDDFKEINDSHCHECGDYVLTEIGRTLSQSTQKKDCVARWGGEEFLILLPETTLSQATITAERLRLTIADKEFSYNEISLKITFSAGIAEYQQGLRLDDLINTADRLLYRAKHGGKIWLLLITLPQIKLSPDLGRALVSKIQLRLISKRLGQEINIAFL